MDSSIEKKVVKGCLQGDKKSWDQFVETYQKLIYSIIHRTLRQYNYSQDSLDDLFQNVFLSFLKNDCAKLRSFKWKNNSSLSTWISVVTRNLVLDYIRKEGKKQKVTSSLNSLVKVEDKQEFVEIMEDQKYATEHMLNDQEIKEVLIAAIKKLSEADKLLAELIFFQEVSYEKAAEILGKSVDAIYMQKKRLIEKLQKKVKIPC
jgi:RNA polymerase sigma-70 factor (ECF subfamily)